MKRHILLAAITSLSILTTTSSCKDKASEPTQEVPQPPPADSNAGVQDPGSLIGPEREEVMITNIAKLSNDYPTVMIEVDNGEVILKGTLEKKRLEKLLEDLKHLEPKPAKVTNQLTVK